MDPVLARIPPAARPETMEGAAAYVAYYFEQLNAASRAGDPGPLQGLASSLCKTCEAFRMGVDDLRKKGEHFGGDTLRINYSTAQVYSDADRTVLIDIVQVAVPVVDRTGRRVRMTTRGKGAFVATVSFDRHWIIDRLQVAK
ncbi:MAG TPA: DUF6318 family protein [Intrasporangium sp.]|uniref:DUF6318 family protein n=1 Tax=Intrasporangium sp. TaxID=1925024 RepID=UPI002D785077|nr:DUF6318 family protein [Intrasporangium sp.]HET7396909.1 DUF6318 family protein [Intrasporangium sp.]